jgi:hypothetical protein
MAGKEKEEPHQWWGTPLHIAGHRLSTGFDHCADVGKMVPFATPAYLSAAPGWNRTAAQVIGLLSM